MAGEMLRHYLRKGFKMEATQMATEFQKSTCGIERSKRPLTSVFIRNNSVFLEKPRSQICIDFDQLFDKTSDTVAAKYKGSSGRIYSIRTYIQKTTDETFPSR